MTLKKLKGDQVYIYRFYYINLFIFFIFFLRIQVIIWCHFLTSFPTHLLCFVTVEYTTSLCITFPVSSTILLIYTYCVMQLVFKSVKKMQLYSQNYHCVLTRASSADVLSYVICLQPKVVSLYYFFYGRSVSIEFSQFFSLRSLFFRIHFQVLLDVRFLVEFSVFSTLNEYSVALPF